MYELCVPCRLQSMYICWYTWETNCSLLVLYFDLMTYRFSHCVFFSDKLWARIVTKSCFLLRAMNHAFMLLTQTFPETCDVWRY